MTEREGDWGETERDAEQRAEAEINLDDPSATDDVPWSPPDRQPRGSELIGVETDGGETIDQRIRQEEPEVGTAYGAPDPHGEADETEPDMLGGDDPDAIEAETDVLGGPAGDDLSGHDRPSGGTSPESSAMHVVEDS